MFDDHHRGVRNIHANFNHGGGHQNVQFALLEQAHDLFFQIGIHAAVQHGDPQVRKDAVAQLFVHLHGSFQLSLFNFLDHGIHDVRLMSSNYLLAHEIPDFWGALIRHAAGDDRGASGRHFVDYAYVEV